MKRLLPALLVLTSCTTVLERPLALTVYEVSKQRAALKGEVIRVTGIVRQCQHLSCSLISPTNDEHFISLGGSEDFDFVIQHVLGREIVVEGTFIGRCVTDFDDDVIALCSDRPADLANPVLIWPKVQ